MNEIADLVIVDAHSDYPLHVHRERLADGRRVIENRHLPALAAGGVTFETATVGGDFKLGAYDFRNPLNVLNTLDAIHQEVAESTDTLRLILKKSDLKGVGTGGTLSMMLALEGAACVTDDFAMLRNYYSLGVRALSLTHNPKNIFADGCEEESGGGLSELGKKLVREINRYDLILDLVHINERGFFEALELSENPVLVSHSNAKAICDSFRNLTDEQITAVGRRGGVVGVNCAGFMIHEESEKQTVDNLLVHVDYMVDLVGIDHVGFGPDYVDYMMDLLEAWLKQSDLPFDTVQYAIGASDVSAMPVFVRGLADRGYSESDIRKLMGGNFLRVYEQGLPV